MSVNSSASTRGRVNAIQKERVGKSQGNCLQRYKLSFNLTKYYRLILQGRSDKHSTTSSSDFELSSSAGRLIRSAKMVLIIASPYYCFITCMQCYRNPQFLLLAFMVGHHAAGGIL